MRQMQMRRWRCSMWREVVRFVLIATTACALSCGRTSAPASVVDVTPAHVGMSASAGEPICWNFAEGGACSVSFIHLLAHPERYHGKRVQLIGYMRLEFEGNSLYLSRELYEHGGMHDALWIDVEGMTATPRFDEGWALIEGTFNAEARGHFGMFAGSVEKITRLDRWETPR
jgi:hypothetical protein